MCESILVPTDGSGHAEDAYERAVELAERCGADPHLLHVVDTNRFSETALSSSPLVVGAQEDEGTQLLKKLSGAARERGIPAQSHGCHGDPCEEILGYVEERDVDLVVMGYQGQDHDRSLGSATNRVVRARDRPVMLV